MTILFINSIGKNKWGGGEKWIVNTASGLQALGHKIIVGGRRNSVLIKNASDRGIKTMHISYRSDFSVLSALSLTQFINEHKISVIVASMNRDVRVAGFAALLSKNRPQVIGRQGVQLITNKWKYKFTFNNFAHGILTNSKSIKEIYDSYKWWDDSFVKVIYNGIAQSETCSESFDYSKICTLSTDTKIILSAGRLDKQKGFIYLIEAAKISKLNNDDHKYFIAGSGKLHKYLSQLIAEYRLQDYVYLLGFVENIHCLFEGADIFVLPSLYEGMPNVLLESMLEKLPVITTPVNGAKELVEDGETGFFIPVKDPSAIYRKIKFVLNNPQLSSKIADQAQNTVLTKFSLEQSVKNVERYLLQKLEEKDVKTAAKKSNCLSKSISKVKSFSHKQSKLGYYVSNFARLKFTPSFSSDGLSEKLKLAVNFDAEYLESRVNYYNQLTNDVTLSDSTKRLSDFIYTGKLKTYFFDTWIYTRFFKPENKFSYEFGDVTTIPDQPTIVKSRPISDVNQNSILLKLNKVRHFNFVSDCVPFNKKQNRLVWRGNIWKRQPQRIEFLEKNFNNNMCDVGHVNQTEFETSWLKSKLSIAEQLQYKFILSLEGNDVASNLKWIMASNSIAVMPTPKYETWFMEGTLKPDYHYIHINDDYSDLNQKLEYYIRFPEKAEEIRLNANEFASQFKDKKREDLISVLVLKKYFEKTK